MTTRQFYQEAQAYGPIPATVVVTLDNAVIYDGSIAALDQPPPSMPSPGFVLPVAYSWEGTCEFSGALPMTITVQGAEIYLGNTVAQTWDPIGNIWIISDFFTQTIDGQIVNDCFTNVEINGVPQTRLATPDGQWWWLIPAGSQFSATINIQSCPTP